MATITLTINAESAVDLVNEIRNLQAAIGMQIANHEQVSEIKTAAVKDAPAPAKEKAAPKAKPATKPALETKAEETKAEEVKTEETKSDSGLTKDDVAAALSELSAAKGMAVAKEVLARFKSKADAPCMRMSDIQESDYEDFVNTCRAQANS